jgi:hypothetical protein
MAVAPKHRRQGPVCPKGNSMQILKGILILAVILAVGYCDVVLAFCL